MAAIPKMIDENVLIFCEIVTQFNSLITENLLTFKGDPNLPNTNCFQSIFTPWAEALGWHRSLNHGWGVEKQE